jgi:hypothetical protein
MAKKIDFTNNYQDISTDRDFNSSLTVSVAGVALRAVLRALPPDM